MNVYKMFPIMQSSRLVVSYQNLNVAVGCTYDSTSLCKADLVERQSEEINLHCN